MKRSLLCIGLLTILSTAPYAQAENPKLRKEIEAVYAKFDRLVAKGDIKAVKDMLDPTFKLTDLDGRTMGKDEVCHEMTQQMKNIQSIKSKVVVDQIIEQGDEVVAWITMNMEMNLKQNGKVISVSFTGKYAETLKKTPKGWKFIFTQVLPN